MAVKTRRWCEKSLVFLPPLHRYAGGFCPLGSSKPQPCPDGYFNNATGAFDYTFCIPCLPVRDLATFSPAFDNRVFLSPRSTLLFVMPSSPSQGSYCQGSSNPYPSGPCAAGYYCTGNASTPTQFITPIGFYSLEGASAPQPCPPGTYQTARGQAACLPCEAKYFCPNQSTVELTPCLRGGYCPPGSSQPLPCPVGTFSGAVGNANVSQCEPCAPGQFCSSTGLTAPAGPCNAGFYCTGGASIPNPAEDGTLQPFGGVCPSGHYCGNGTVAPVACPSGRFNAATGSTTLSECQPCSPAMYCSASGLPAPEGLCSAGFYCASGSVTPTPMFLYLSDPSGGLCPPGSYCVNGSSAPTSCPAGTYTNVSGTAACTTCPARHYCPTTGMSIPLPCPQGSFCEVGTASVLNPCPLGRFSNVTLVRWYAYCP